MTILILLMVLFIATAVLSFIALLLHKADERVVVSSFILLSWKAANRILIAIIAVSLFSIGVTSEFMDTLVNLLE